jgi:hypothetical protein
LQQSNCDIVNRKAGGGDSVRFPIGSVPVKHEVGAVAIHDFCQTEIAGKGARVARCGVVSQAAVRVPIKMVWVNPVDSAEHIPGQSQAAYSIYPILSLRQAI